MDLSEVVQIEVLEEKIVMNKTFKKGERIDAQIVYNGDAQPVLHKFVRFQPHQYRIIIPDNLYEMLLY